MDYFIKDYKLNLNVKIADEVYTGSAFITFSNIPSNKYFILNCDKSIIINSVRYRGKGIPYNYNQFSHILQISSEIEDYDQIPNSNNDNNNDSNNNNNNQNDTNTTVTEKSDFVVGISFEAPLNPDGKGFVYVDDETAFVHLFPNFSSQFIPCDLFTSEESDVNNQQNSTFLPKFQYKQANISMNITPGEGSQIVACSIPFAKVSDFINNRKMFRFEKLKFPLPYLAVAIGNYNKYEIEINKELNGNSNEIDSTTKIHFFFDSHIEENSIDSIISFIEKVATKIEKAFNLKPFENCLQIADVYSFPEEESNTAGIVIFTPETLNEFNKNELFITKQIIKQFLNVFPATVNENWIIEGLSSYLSLVILHSLSIEKENEKKEFEFEFENNSMIEINQNLYQLKFFRVTLNTDSTSQVNSIAEKISLIDDETLFDSVYINKSTCLFRMLFLNKNFEFCRNSINKMKERAESEESLTTENFLDSFNCIQSEPYFESYFKNQGYPIVILDDDLTIHQTRFTFSRNSTDFLWKIPLKIIVLKLNTDDNSKSENIFNEIKTVSLLFDKKEFNLKNSIQIENLDDKLLIVNPNSETICRVWYKGKWMSKICENTEFLSKSKFRSDLFNIFMDVTALSELGFVNKKIVESFKMFEIPQELRRRFPMSRGNGSILSTFQ